MSKIAQIFAKFQFEKVSLREKGVISPQGRHFFCILLYLFAQLELSYINRVTNRLTPTYTQISYGEKGSGKFKAK